MSWVAVAIGGSALVSAYSANKAGKAGQEGARYGVDAQERMYGQMRDDLSPWMTAGQTSLKELMERMGLATPQSRMNMQRPTREQFTTNTPGAPSERSWFNPNPSQGTTSFDQPGYDEAMGRYNEAVAGAGQNPENFGSLMQPFGLDKFEESPGYQFNLEQGMEAIRKGAAANYGNTYSPTTLRDMGKFAQGTASNEYQASYNRYNADQATVYGRLMGQSESGRGAAAQVGQAGVQTGQGVAESIAGGANARAAGYIGVGNAVNQGVGDAYNNYLMQSIINNQRGSYGAGTQQGSGYTR